VIVCFVNIGGIVDHHCLSFLFIIKIIVPMYVAIFPESPLFVNIYWRKWRFGRACYIWVIKYVLCYIWSEICEGKTLYEIPLPTQNDNQFIHHNCT